MSKTLLVTGASGQLASAVIRLLLDGHRVAPSSIIATTRTPERLDSLSALGVHVRHADFDHIDGLTTAFDGAQRMLLVSTDAPPGRRLAQQRAAIEAAAWAGVRHVVYTSIPNPDADSPIPFAADHRGTEEELRLSGLTWTVLRNAWYMENLLRFLLPAIASGQWSSAAGQGRIAYIARHDCARVAAAVLASRRTGNDIFDITGSEAHSTQDIAELASVVTGRPIRVDHVAAATQHERLLAAGVPAPAAQLFTAFDVNTALGRVAKVTHAVTELTGSPAQRLREFLIQHRHQLLA